MTKEELEQIIATSKVPVLVEFYADWCGPCKIMEPIVEELRVELGNRAKIFAINAEQEQGLANSYSVLSFPTFFIFREGEKKQLSGIQTRNVLKSLLVK